MYTSVHVYICVSLQCVYVCRCHVGTYIRTYICSSRSATSQLMKDKDQPSGSGLIAASKTSVGVESTAAMRYVCVYSVGPKHTHIERETHIF